MNITPKNQAARLNNKNILYHAGMKRRTALFILVLVFSAQAFNQLPDASIHHIRNGKSREWSSFPEVVKDSSLTIQFSSTYTGTGTLSLTQFDVNQTWRVMLNGKHLGNLTLDEKLMTSYFNIPAGLLKQKNSLNIVPDPASPNRSDDISISNIFIAPKPATDLFSEASVGVTVTNKEHIPLPSRLTIVNKNGALQPVSAEAGDSLAVRTGVIYSATGYFTFKLPAGSYKVYASRGFEYGVDSMTLELSSHKIVSKHFVLEHEIVLPDWKSIDPHVHTQEFSGHGDASMNERIISIAGEGLNYAAITEHNKAIDIADQVKVRGLEKWLVPITGDELTTPVGHFNILPVEPGRIPEHDVKTWKEVQQNLDKIPGKKIVILNHARDGHAGVRPIDSLQARNVSALPFNAMEVMNSGSQQTDPRQLYMDWLTLIGRGIVLTPVGSSDSHDVSRFIVGQSRTYVRSAGDLMDNFLKGRAGVSFGLFTTLNLDSAAEPGKLRILMRVYAPSWTKPTNVALYANNEKIFSDVVGDKDRQVGHYYEKDLTITRPPHGVYLTAIAEGPDPKVPWWPIARPYTWTSPDVTAIVLGISEVLKMP